VSTIFVPNIDMTDPPTRGAAQGKTEEMMMELKKIKGKFKVAS
jgi:hypothetical protein